MRKLCWCTSAFTLAVFCAVYLLPGSLLFQTGGLCLLGGFVSLLFRKNVRQRIFLAFLGLTIGFLWTGCYNVLVRAPSRTLIGETAQDYTLVVTDFPKETNQGASLSAKLQTEGLPAAKIQLYVGTSALDYCPGDVISGSIRLTASNLLRGKSTDYYEAKGIFLLGYAQDDPVLLTHPASPSLRYVPQYISHVLKSFIKEIFPEDVSGFMMALTTGDKGALPHRSICRLSALRNLPCGRSFRPAHWLSGRTSDPAVWETLLSLRRGRNASYVLLCGCRWLYPLRSPCGVHVLPPAIGASGRP